MIKEKEISMQFYHIKIDRYFVMYCFLILISIRYAVTREFLTVHTVFPGEPTLKLYNKITPENFEQSYPLL